MTADGAVPQGDGYVEYTFRHGLAGADLVKVRLTLSGTSAARPMLYDIRLMAVA